MLKLVFSSWYIVNKSWVKNVNNLRILNSISGVYSSTKRFVLAHRQYSKWVQTLFNHQYLPRYSTTLCTDLINKFKLLNKRFTYYPQSLLIVLPKEI